MKPGMSPSTRDGIRVLGSALGLVAVVYGVLYCLLRLAMLIVGWL